MKKASSLLAAILLASGLLSLSGCIAAIGNDAAPGPNVTLGQQLIDLKKAHDTGVITDAEFEAQRERFLGKKH